MFTSESESRLVNGNAICQEKQKTCGRTSRHSVSSIRQIDTPCEGGGSQLVESVSSPDESAEEKVRRRRTRRFSQRRSTSCSTVSFSSSSLKSTKRKRKKKHKHHHRHRSNRANDSYQQSSSLTPTPKVNPIFVWIKQDDTKIVQVLCEDYDRRNRIRLTKTPNGWRSIPLTERLEKQWPFSTSENVQNNELVKPNLPLTIKPDNLLENKQTDNFNDVVCNQPIKIPDVESAITSTSMENTNELSETFEENFRENVPFVNNDSFDSDESSQDDLRSIINKVQTDSLYSDDEQSNNFCPVNSTCDNLLKSTEENNTIQCAEVSGNEIQSETDNFESQNTNEFIQSPLIANSNEEMYDNSTNGFDKELEKCILNKPHQTSENSLQPIEFKNENRPSSVHKLSQKNELSPFNNQQKVHDQSIHSDNKVENFDLRDNDVQSSVQDDVSQSYCESVHVEKLSNEVSQQICESSEGGIALAKNDVSFQNCESQEEAVSEGNTDISPLICESLEENISQSNDEIFRQNCESSEENISQSKNYEALKYEPNRSDNECSLPETAENGETVDSSSKCDFSNRVVPVVANIKTEKVDTNEIIDDHLDEYDFKKDKLVVESLKPCDEIKKLNQVVLRSPLCQTLKSSKFCRKISKKSRHLDNLKIEPLPAHNQSAISQSTSEISDLSFGTKFVENNEQNEPLDLGINRSKELEPNKKLINLIENREFSQRKRIRSEEKSDKENEEKKMKKSRLLDLLTNKTVPSEISISDPMEQLKNVLSNPKYSVPDPLLVPKARLSALVSCPGKEIPRLLARRTQDLSYFSILSDPDVLVVSLSHLQSLIKKPINEEEIQKYQKQTEEIRSRLRQECFNNNYENMALGNWNQCYWLPSFQNSGVLPYEQIPPDMLSMFNFVPPSTACCQTVPLSANNANYHKQMQFQKDAALWQEFALQQLSANHPSYDQFNNNMISNCDLGKEGVCGMIWNQDLCSNYGCYPSPKTPPMKTNINSLKTKGFPADSIRKNSQSFVPTIPCGNSMNDYNIFSKEAEVLHSENQYQDEQMKDLKVRSDRYDSLRQLLQNSIENNDLMKQFETQLKNFAEDERKPFKDEKKERSLNTRANVSCKESREAESGKSNRPVVPKIKVRQHLVDPNQRPTLLNTDSPVLHSPGFPHMDYTSGHLWNPFFASNVEKNYRKLQWTTPATSIAD